MQTPGRILERLGATDCGLLGVSFRHLQDPGRKQWLQQRMDESSNTSAFGPPAASALSPAAGRRKAIP